MEKLPSVIKVSIRSLALLCLFQAPAFAEAGPEDTLTLPSKLAASHSAFRGKDSVPSWAGTGLQERLGRFPGMLVDQQGRLKWRGTEEFRIHLSGVPVDADLMAALPSGFEAEVTGEPQPDARQASAGMTGILHLDPKPTGKTSSLKIHSGAGLPARGWAGSSGLWKRPAYEVWGQWQYQGLDEPARERWEGPGGNSIRRRWQDTEQRTLGLVGASGRLGHAQTVDAEVWGNRSDYTRPFSRVRFQEGALDARWRPEGEAENAAGKGSWEWKSQRFLLRMEAAGLTGGQSVDLEEEVLDSHRDWTRGRGSCLWLLSPDVHIEAGSEHAWEGRSMTGLGAEGALWEEKQEAVWLQTQSGWRNLGILKTLKVEAGLRGERVDRSMTDGSYAVTDWRLLPSGAVSGALPWYGLEAYARYSRRMERPQASLVVPGERRVAAFEVHRGNEALKAETVHGTEFGISLPVPAWKSRLEAKAFSALADHMLIRSHAWTGDSTVLSIRNGQGENRRGGEGSWEQEIPGGWYRVYLGGWLEDREVEGPKEELVGISGRLHVTEHLGRFFLLGVDLGWTGPTFEAEGEAESYWEEGLRLDWAPHPRWNLHLGGEAFWGADRGLRIQESGGGSWKRTRYDNGPRAWASLEWRN
jgi:hypothetical protein